MSPFCAARRLIIPDGTATIGEHKNATNISAELVTNEELVVGLTQLGLRINAALPVPNQTRLNTIILLIEESDFSIHDLSRIEA